MIDEASQRQRAYVRGDEAPLGCAMKRVNDKSSAARLRLVSDRPTDADASEPQPDDLERELALERREMRRALAAKLTSEHGASLWSQAREKGGSPARERDHAPALPQRAAGDTTPNETAHARRVKLFAQAPVLAAASVACVLALGYLICEAAFTDGANDATSRLVRALVVLPVIWGLAIGAAIVVQTRFERSAVHLAKGTDERRRQMLELELALERRRMRRALAAKLIKDYRRDSSAVSAGELRAALTERDLAEEECEALDRSISRNDAPVDGTDHPGPTKALPRRL